MRGSRPLIFIVGRRCGMAAFGAGMAVELGGCSISEPFWSGGPCRTCCAHAVAGAGGGGPGEGEKETARVMVLVCKSL